MLTTNGSKAEDKFDGILDEIEDSGVSETYEFWRGSVGLKDKVFLKKATVEKMASFCLYRVNLLLTLLTAV